MQSAWAEWFYCLILFSGCFWLSCHFLNYIGNMKESTPCPRLQQLFNQTAGLPLRVASVLSGSGSSSFCVCVCLVTQSCLPL